MATGEEPEFDAAGNAVPIPTRLRPAWVPSLCAFLRTEGQGGAGFRLLRSCPHRARIARMSRHEPLTMPLEEAMCTQRAIRRLKSDPVDDALVLHLIELALRAPTGSNAQNWEFIVVKDRAAKAKLGRLNRFAFGLYGAIGRRMAARSGDEGMRKIINAVQWQADHFED